MQRDYAFRKLQDRTMVTDAPFHSLTAMRSTGAMPVFTLACWGAFAPVKKQQP